MKKITSEQLAKALKSGWEAAKLLKEWFDKVFSCKYNNFQSAGQNFEICPWSRQVSK